MPRCLAIMTSFFDRFLIDFSSQLRPPEPSKSLFFLRKNKVFSKNHQSKLTSIFDRFWSQFTSILHQKIDQKSSKNHQKIDPKRHPKNDPNFDGFLDHLGSILGAKLEPCWPLFPPKTPQDAPKTPQDAPKTPSKPPRTRPGGAAKGEKTQDFFGIDSGMGGH